MRFLPRAGVVLPLACVLACGGPERPVVARDSAATAIDGAFNAASITAAPDSATLAYREGRVALDRGDTTIAIGHFDQAMRWPLSVGATQARYWKAFVLARRGAGEDLAIARNLLQLTLQLAPQSYATSDASMLLLRVQARLAEQGDRFALQELEATPATAIACGDATSARLAWAADPRVDDATHATRLSSLLAERVPCGALLREQALLLLARLPGEAGVPPILRTVSGDPSRAVRRAALRVLPSPVPVQAQPLLRAILDTGHDAITLEFAAGAWHSRRAEWGTEPLERFLARPDRNATAAHYVESLLQR